MKSIKPGRMPSRMGVVMGIVTALFGVIWTVSAVSMGAPIFFALFGVLFIAVALYSVWYNYKNATSDNRYSVYDITDDTEEPDPLNMKYGTNRPSRDAASGTDAQANYCPYCGQKLGDDHRFCKNCGAKVE